MEEDKEEDLLLLVLLWEEDEKEDEQCTWDEDEKEDEGEDEEGDGDRTSSCIWNRSEASLHRRSKIAHHSDKSYDRSLACAPARVDT